jgi:hypothetical protein
VCIFDIDKYISLYVNAIMVRAIARTIHTHSKGWARIVYFPPCQNVDHRIGNCLRKYVQNTKT